MHKTSDGIEITTGLRVFTNDWAWGTVIGHRYDGWFDVKMDSGRISLYNGERMTTQRP